MEQLGLLDKEELQRCQVEEKTVVKLGRHSAKIPLKRRRREAIVLLERWYPEPEILKFPMTLR